MARIGITRRTTEGPKDFAGRAGRLRRDLEQAVDEITGLYVAVRYAGDVQSFDALRQRIRIFKPSRSHNR